MTDMFYDKTNERPMEHLTIGEPFTYNPDRMNTVINGLGGEEIEFHDGGPSAYFITTKDTKATAIIAKINKA